MKKNFQILILSLFSMMLCTSTFAEENVNMRKKSVSIHKSATATCAQPAGFQTLQVNNVSARINTGGDLWWGHEGPGKYFIPGGSTKSSMYASALWIGGVDINEQLKLAAIDYATGGTDYWTGPLKVDGTAAVDEAVCAKYDKLFVITRAEVDRFLGWFESTNKTEEYPGYVIPESILDWPAHGDVDLHQSYYLAPFMDVDGDGEYDPGKGDYPYYDIDNSLCPLNRKPGDLPLHTDEEVLTEYDIALTGSILSDQIIKGDETFWWVFNDKGNIHTISNGDAIGLEIRAQAFGFTTNDEVNNMTFYSYEIINRSTFELDDTYFSPWVDVDLGYAYDDYVGCDVERGLGYAYNGFAVDGNGQPEAYGDQPPAIGVDFFQGPYVDADGFDNPSYKGSGILGPSFKGKCDIVTANGSVIFMDYGPEGSIKTDSFLVIAEAINGVNFGNGIIDDERYGMRRFVYYDNGGGSILGDPSDAPDFYNFLRGRWKDNVEMTYGGKGHPSSAGSVGPVCRFMFPDDSDPCNWGTEGMLPNGGYNQNGLYWNEETAGNQPDDRRFMQSAGPFNLRSGAVNYITVGIPWAKAPAGGPWASVELLRVVDDKCQALFDNCFKIIDGPSAPDLAIQELDKELIIYINNRPTSNNFNEEYAEVDPFINFPPGLPSEMRDSVYTFEGYQIYQLENSDVAVDELDDLDKARLIAQFDVQNDISKLVNFVFDQSIGANVPVVMVDGGNEGISHTFVVTEDAFATGNVKLVNHKQYYFMALAYSHNNYLPYSQDPDVQDVENGNLSGQKSPYLVGRKNIKTYTAIPHIPINGIIQNSAYGEGPEIVRVEGQGNGGVSLELSDESVNELLSKSLAESVTSSGDTISFGHPDYPIVYNAKYKIGHGPLDIKVIDPLNVVNGNFTLKFVNVEQPAGDIDSINIDRANWVLTNNTTNETYLSNTTIDIKNEKMIPEIGLSVSIHQSYFPGDHVNDVTNGLIETFEVYADSSRQWMSGVQDNQIPLDPFNWIRSGSYSSPATGGNDWNGTDPWDPNEVYESIAGGTVAPYPLVASEGQGQVVGPALSANSKTFSKMEYLSSVDIVLTPDKSKWSRSLVIEMGTDPLLNEALADGTPVNKFNIRASQSIDKDGNFAEIGSGSSNNPDDPNFIFENGMGWFPGYAIKLETAERLNIMYGENSWLVNQNGRDMQFNPTLRDLTLDGDMMRFDPNIFNNIGIGEAYGGGMHFFYVLDHRKTLKPVSSLVFEFRSPAYDGCNWMYTMIDSLTGTVYKSLLDDVFANTLYVGFPMGVKGREWLSNDYTLKIRVSKPYQRYYSTSFATDEIVNSNDHFPMYTFNTESVATEYFNPEKEVTDLDLINVVPNPYYAYSEYEANSLQNIIKVTNLPQVCTVTIYAVDGIMIRQFKKDAAITSIDWDLKNHAGVPVASGIYLIHIKSDAGERIIKFFGTMRQIDLNTF